MKIPRDISGPHLVNALCRDFGYQRVHQVGSHIILQTEQPTAQRIAVPAHSTLRIGTLNAILRAVAEHKGISRDALLKVL